MRARKSAAAILGICALMAGPTGAAAQGPPPIETEQMRIFDRYMGIVERMYSCGLEEVWQTLDRLDRRACRRLQRRYVLYSLPGESYDFHIKCKTRICPTTPNGHPPADGPVPPGARVYNS